ncbi:hypothetical protein LJR231_003481 [Phyllobacterium sp. LjRoot231]|uniref:hypothetical protein n=1 Tax=Phyllobacterium sp. LjRoot231 TaxID=3342289 RepID=UPI003ED1543A
MSLTHRFEVIDELSAVLDSERAEAIYEHRKAMGKAKALTPYAAKLLAKQFARFNDPNAAADEMILRGWMAIKLEWMAREQRTARPHSVGESALQEIQQGNANAPTAFERMLTARNTTGNAQEPGNAQIITLPSYRHG